MNYGRQLHGVDKNTKESDAGIRSGRTVIDAGMTMTKGKMHLQLQISPYYTSISFVMYIQHTTYTHPVWRCPKSSDIR